MRFSILEQRLVSQLHAMYASFPIDEDMVEDWYKNTISVPVNCAELYEYLVKDPLWIPPDAQTKQQLWNNARKGFNKENKHRILTLAKTYDKQLKMAQGSNKLSDEEIISIAKERADKELKNDLNRVFKSFLVRNFLADNFYKNKTETYITDKDNNEIKPIKWMQEK